MSVFDIVYKCLNFLYKFKINGSKLLFLWCLFLAKNEVQKGVYRNDGLFLQWDRIESAPDESLLYYLFHIAP